MDKKKKKRHICIDCEEKTSNFYTIPTNRGNIIKCAGCYELWVMRSTRASYGSNNGAGKTNNWEE
jgi:hypothetical protein